MSLSIFLIVLVNLVATCGYVDSFVVTAPIAGQRHTSQPSKSTLWQAVENEEADRLGMTPELRKVVNAFCAIPDEQTRYKQLLYMAQNTKRVGTLPKSSKIPQNKVPGCLSTVYIDGTAEYNDELKDYIINFVGESDGLLTRGLVALLVRCLSGNTADAIQKVNPEFIKLAKIEQSLTPGRNNGFLNMLATLKRKAFALDAAARGNGQNGDSSGTENSGHGPKYNAIITALSALKPTSLELVDNSHEHAGHSGNDMEGESHFQLSIVAEVFEELPLVKRHQLIYMILGDIMSQIHALQIRALTPQEAAEQ